MGKNGKQQNDTRTHTASSRSNNPSQAVSGPSSKEVGPPDEARDAGTTHVSPEAVALAGRKFKFSMVSGLLGLLLGSGGAFGVVKYYDTRELDRLKREYEIAVAKSQEVGTLQTQRRELQTELDNLRANPSGWSPERVEFIKQQLAAVLADLERLSNNASLPGWATDQMKTAQANMRRLIN